jgi:hypothetical protein
MRTVVDTEAVASCMNAQSASKSASEMMNERDMECSECVRVDVWMV